MRTSQGRNLVAPALADAGRLIRSEPDLDVGDAEDFLNLRLNAFDARYVVQHDRAALAGRGDHETPRSEQKVLENVGDVLVELNARGRQPFETAENAVVVDQLVGADFPIVEPGVNDEDHDQHQRENKRDDEIELG